MYIYFNHIALVYYFKKGHCKAHNKRLPLSHARHFHTFVVMSLIWSYLHGHRHMLPTPVQCTTQHFQFH